MKFFAVSAIVGIAAVFAVVDSADPMPTPSTRGPNGSVEANEDICTATTMSKVPSTYKSPNIAAFINVPLAALSLGKNRNMTCMYTSVVLTVSADGKMFTFTAADNSTQVFKKNTMDQGATQVTPSADSGNQALTFVSANGNLKNKVFYALNCVKGTKDFFWVTFVLKSVLDSVKSDESLKIRLMIDIASDGFQPDKCLAGYNQAIGELLPVAKAPKCTIEANEDICTSTIMSKTPADYMAPDISAFVNKPLAAFTLGKDRNMTCMYNREVLTVSADGKTFTFTATNNSLEVFKKNTMDQGATQVTPSAAQGSLALTFVSAIANLKNKVFYGLICVKGTKNFYWVVFVLKSELDKLKNNEAKRNQFLFDQTQDGFRPDKCTDALNMAFRDNTS